MLQSLDKIDFLLNNPYMKDQLLSKDLFCYTCFDSSSSTWSYFNLSSSTYVYLFLLSLFDFLIYEGIDANGPTVSFTNGLSLWEILDG